MYKHWLMRGKKKRCSMAQNVLYLRSRILQQYVTSATWNNLDINIKKIRSKYVCLQLHAPLIYHFHLPSPIFSTLCREGFSATTNSFDLLSTYQCPWLSKIFLCGHMNSLAEEYLSCCSQQLMLQLCMNSKSTIRSVACTENNNYQ